MENNRTCTIDGHNCDFWQGHVRPKDRLYWITTSTCHLSSKGFPTGTYECSPKQGEIEYHLTGADVKPVECTMPAPRSTDVDNNRHQGNIKIYARVYATCEGTIYFNLYQDIDNYRAAARDLTDKQMRRIQAQLGKKIWRFQHPRWPWSKRLKDRDLVNMNFEVEVKG